MKTKNQIFLILLLTSMLSSCWVASWHRSVRMYGFTYRYKNEITNLDKKLRIDGFYMTSDSSECIAFMPDGTFARCNYAKIPFDSLINKTNSLNDTRYDQNLNAISWGLYEQDNETINVQYSFTAFDFHVNHSAYKIENDTTLTLDEHTLYWGSDFFYYPNRLFGSKVRYALNPKVVFHFVPSDVNIGQYNWMLNKKYYWDKKVWKQKKKQEK